MRSGSPQKPVEMRQRLGRRAQRPVVGRIWGLSVDVSSGQREALKLALVVEGTASPDGSNSTPMVRFSTNALNLGLCRAGVEGGLAASVVSCRVAVHAWRPPIYLPASEGQDNFKSTGASREMRTGTNPRPGGVGRS